MNLKKILAAIFAAMMCVAVMSFAALADGNEAKIGETEYPTIEEAIEEADDGDTIEILCTDIQIETQKAVTISTTAKSTITIDAPQATLNAWEDITFICENVVGGFSATYYNHTVTIGEGASLEITGTGRATLGYGNVFNITGTIADAKNTDKADVTPSLVIPGGISITGGNDAEMNVENAYVIIGSTTSKDKEANGEFTLSFVNSIAEFTNQLTLSEPTSGKNPTFNLNIKDSVLTTGTKLIVAAPNTTTVIDNSTVTLATYFRNSGNMTLKNESVLTGSTIQFGENGGNDGTTIVDNSTFNITATSAGHALDGNGTGEIVLKNGATANVGYITDSTVLIKDATVEFAGKVVGTESVTFETPEDVDIVVNEDGVSEVRVVVAKIDDKSFYSIKDAFENAEKGDTIVIYKNLEEFADLVNSGTSFAGITVKLGADFDLEGVEWTPIGNSSNKFEGYFDGANHTISNLTVAGDNDYAGLFGYIKGTSMTATATPTVQNLKIVNASVEGDYYVGALAGQGYTCNVTNVTVEGEVSGYRYVGGLIGHVYTYFENCYFKGDVYGSFDAAGGIAGAGDGRVYNSSVIGEVSGNNWVGGIIGNGQEGTSAVGCYVKATVSTGTNYYHGVGGIAGVAGHGYASSEFRNNYFDGEVYLCGEKTDAIIMGLVNAKSNADIKATVAGNSWNTEYYPADTMVYVVADVTSSTPSDDDWKAGAFEELTQGRNNNLVMLESDLEYVDAENADDVVIMDFSEVTEDQVETAVVKNQNVAYIDRNGNDEFDIGEEFDSLSAAFAAVEDGETIELIADAELEKAIAFTKDIEFTLDGNGYSIVPAEGSTEANSAFNLGQGNDSTIATRKYTIKNVVFDGWTTDHVIRLQGVDSVVENCKFINCNQPDGLGLLTLTFCEAEVIGCVFENNTCVEVIDINSWGDNSQGEILIENCTFSENVCNSPAAILYSYGKALTINDCDFIENKVNTAANGAVVYCGYKANVAITDCYFEGNEIDSASETERRVSPTIFVGNACEISGNAFIGNTATRNGEDDGLAQMVVSTYYSDINLGGNYWGGSAPVAGVDYNRIHEDMGFDFEISDYYTEFNPETGELGGSDEFIANIGDQFYGTLQEAVSAAGENAVIELRPITITEGTIKLPATIKNLTILGTKQENSDVVLAADDAVTQTTIKDTTIMSSDGSSINYDGFTVDGIIFDNSNIVMTGWRTSGEIYKNFTITNNVFKNIERTSNYAALHLNMATAYPLVNLTFENNVIDGVSGSQNSGIYTTSVDGNVVINNNVINNVAFRPFVIQFNNDNGNADTFTVTGNTFSGSAKGRLQALTTNAAGTDAVTINVNGNAIVGITSTQAICFWNFNEETTTVDFSKNFYGNYDPTKNFSRFYYNSAADSYADIIDMGILPYYTVVAFDENGKPVFDPEDLVDGLTEDITVSFDKVEPAVEGELTYNINLVAKTDSIINRLNSGDLTFVLTQGAVGANKYEIIDIEDDDIQVNHVDGGRYEFHFKTKTDIENSDTAKTITIAQVKFTGYGKFSFGIDTTANDTNAVHTTTIVDNIVDTYLPEGVKESDGSEPEGTLDVGATFADEIIVPTRALTINITFPNAVENKASDYQQMTVKISGEDLEKPVVIKLGSDFVISDYKTPEKEYAAIKAEFADGAYKLEISDLLIKGNKYNVEVSGAGYRTAYYTVQMTENKALKFWNNVKDAGKVIEYTYGEEGALVAKENADKPLTTFLAGDIVNDGLINIYDLSAVVSYFGEINLVEDNKYEYAKYDLNRDGLIDSKDVAYVLVSWNY